MFILPDHAKTIWTRCGTGAVRRDTGRVEQDEIADQQWHRHKVLRATFGLIFVVGVFVVAPVVAMFANAR